MLTKEQAAEELSKVMVEGWHERKVGKWLEKKLGRPVKRFLSPDADEDDDTNSSALEDAFREACKALALDDGDQAVVVLTESFPKLAGELRAAWPAFDRQPYQVGWDRRPFRAPGHRAVLERRAEWVASVIGNLHSFDRGVEWLAGWSETLRSVDLRWHAHEATVPLLIAALDGEKKTSDAVLAVLMDCATGRHEVGVMGPAVVEALLGSKNVRAWEFVEKLLISAKREEGLRQAILEAVDLAHPDAFRRMLRLILDESLVRFSATVRAIDVWFGLGYDAIATKHAESIIENVLKLLDDSKAQERALSGKDGELAYLALWCIAYVDAPKAIDRASQVLRESRVADVRFAAVQLLCHVILTDAQAPLYEAIQDADLRVAAAAFEGWRHLRSIERDRHEEKSELLQSPEIAQRLHGLLARLKGKRTPLKGSALPWAHKSIDTAVVLRSVLDETSVDEASTLIPFIERMDANTRAEFAWSLAGNIRIRAKVGYGYEYQAVHKRIEPPHRATLLELLGDAAKEVRAAAFGCFAPHRVEADEMRVLESLLDRKASDLRTSAIERLLKADDQSVLESAERLLGNANSERRLAGLEIAGRLIGGKRLADRAKSAVEGWQRSTKKPTKQEAAFAAELLSASSAKYRIDDCLGLLDDSKRIKPKPVETSEPPIELKEQGLRMLWSVHDFVEKNKAIEISARQDNGQPDLASEATLLGGDYRWCSEHTQDARTCAENLERIAPRLRALLLEWAALHSYQWNETEKEELLLACVQWRCAQWRVNFGDAAIPLVGGGKKKPKFEGGLDLLLHWALLLWCGDTARNKLLDWAERCAAVDLLRKPAIEGRGSSADVRGRFGFLRNARSRNEKYCGSFEPRFASDWLAIARSLPFRMTVSDCARIMNLCRLAEDFQGSWQDRQKSRLTRTEALDPWGYDDRLCDGPMVLEPTADEFLTAWSIGACNEQDLFRLALMPEQQEAEQDSRVGPFASFGFLGSLYEAYWTATRNRSNFDEALERSAERMFARALEVEFSRGDGVTPVTGLVSAGGPPLNAEQVLRALLGLGNQRLVRSSYIANDGSRAAVFSSLVQNSRPGKLDTPASFSAAANTLGVSETRLLELAVYAPHWARHVEHTLKWPGLEDAVWWLRAHTKDSSYVIEDEVRDTWDACISERSPVSKDDFQDGAVDVEWFRRVYEALGKKRWEAIYDAAKFACGGAGHKRAQLFADALLGNVSEKELVARIDDKRHQDSVRALGLVDLGKGAAREKRVLARYQLMQEFRRTSRKHGGSMLQASEKRAVEIGMENLARLAGYADPLRLQWAMETRETADLADGPVIVKAGDVQVSLRVNEEGVPEVEAVKKGKALASVPPGAKKLPAVKELAERATQLRRQASRMKLALEQAMCRGDEFEASELKTLWSHPVLRPMLSRVVFVGDGLMGYPDKKGAVLRGHDGKLEPLKGSDRLRIAHPVDFLRAKGGGKKKGWELWQRECFGAERVQPFKQVFRELYVLTEPEKEKAESLRYQGQQVQPRQALALFGARGWIAKPEEGVQRTFYQEKVTVHTTFEETFYTPADIEGLTMRGLVFTKRSKYEPLKLSEVPERVFSEVMRDLDLVVSVAHRGMTDPEASQSSIEMRAALLREVCAVLKLDNVRIELPRAMIKGEFGEYALHLGSANVQRLPGGSLFILPVHSQHRGRVFLPFADDDPKCAEVMSKVLMLARDSEIRDPGILEQLRG